MSEARERHGLPLGTPIEWLDGMTSPATILAPATPSHGYPIYTMDYSTFMMTSAKDLQDIFRAYPAIVVSGRPTRLKCDLASLGEWGDVDDLRDMHGKLFLPLQRLYISFSIDNSRYDSDEIDAVFVRASYREFLETPKNLNCLDNPLTGGGAYSYAVSY